MPGKRKKKTIEFRMQKLIVEFFFRIVLPVVGKVSDHNRMKEASEPCQSIRLLRAQHPDRDFCFQMHIMSQVYIVYHIKWL